MLSPDAILSNFNQRRIAELGKRLQSLYEDLSEADGALRTADLPTKRREIEAEVQRLKKAIKTAAEELETLQGQDNSWPAGASTPQSPIPQPTEIIKLDELCLTRPALCEKFLQFAAERDLVIAIGGVGSGLKTFQDKFEPYLTSKLTANNVLLPLEARCHSAVFKFKDFDEIYKAREQHEKNIPAARSGTKDVLILKCLLATLAWSTYHVLSGEFPAVVLIPDRTFNDPVMFATHFLESSDVLFGANQGAILEHFYKTVQAYADRTKAARMFVFMPWSGLGERFEDGQLNDDYRLGDKLWNAHGEYVHAKSRRADNRRSGQVLAAAEEKISTHGAKVCLVIMASHAPYAHNTQRQSLVEDCLWPIPPLDRQEVETALKSICPDLVADHLSERILNLTNGIPWLVRLLLTYIKAMCPRGPAVEQEPWVELAFSSCEKAIRDPSTEADPIQEYIDKYIKGIQGALKDPKPGDDIMIEREWLTPASRTRKRYSATSLRIEAFTASGLVFFAGDIWNSRSDNYVFKSFPLVWLLPAGGFAHAAYLRAKGRSDYSEMD